MDGSFVKRSSSKEIDERTESSVDPPAGFSTHWIPDAAGALDLLREAGCSEDVIRHAREVARLALEIAEDLRPETDRNLLEAGALLHDIGRSVTPTFRHVTEGVRIARERGLDESLVRIIERHVGAGLVAKEAAAVGLPEKDYLPETLEEKVVAYADNLVVGHQAVSFRDSLEVFRKRLGDDHPAFQRMRALHRELESLRRFPRETSGGQEGSL